MSKFDNSFKEFVLGCQRIVNDNYLKYDNVEAPVLTVKMGRKYAKLISGTSVYCFVDTTNGNVLKAASWNAPAKHARGNIYNDDHGLTGMSAYGAAYL